MKNRPLKIVFAVFFSLLLLVGLAIVLIPELQVRNEAYQIQQFVDEWEDKVQNGEFSQTGDISVPDENISSEPGPVLPELLHDMSEYNQQIFENGQSGLVDAWSYQTDVFDLTVYGIENDVAGIITIPKINIELPLYLGASYDNLTKGFAQLSQTSMPIGGEGTNCVVACHRGWRGMAYMRDVELLGEGDSVFVQNIWDILEYRVKEAIVIKPHEIENIYIQPGRDLLTIATCHPYGVGSHRYLLICERYQPEEAGNLNETLPKPKEEDRAKAPVNDNINITTSDGAAFVSSQPQIFLQTYFPWLCLSFVVGVLLIVVVSSLLSYVRRRKQYNFKYLRKK